MRFPSGHARILGPPGSGKTTLLVRRFEELDARGPGTTRVLTYSRQSHERLLAAITESSSARLGRPPVYTYLSCAKEAFPRPPEIISGAEEWILLDEVVGKNAARLSSVYKTIHSTARFQKAALDLFHILMQNGISGGRLETLRTSGHCGNRLGDMLMLYGAFCDALEKRALATFYDLVWKAVDWLGSHPELNPFGGALTLLVEDFQDVDAGQYALLTAVAPPGGITAVNVFGDPTGARFGFRGTDHRFLMEAFPSDYGAETIHIAAPGELRRLLPAADVLIRETAADGAEHYLRASPESSPGRVPEALAGAPATARMVKARDEYEEISFVASNIRTMLDQGTIKPEEIAVAARHKHRYEPVVSMIFRQHGIPLETGRTRHTVFRNMVVSLARLVQRPDDDVPLETLSTSGLRPHLEAVLLERYGCEETARAGGADGAPAPSAATSEHGRGKSAIGPAPTEPRAARGFRELMRRYVSELRQREPLRWFEAMLTELVIPAADSYGAPAEEFAPGLQARELLDGWKRYVLFARNIGNSGDSAAFVRLGGFLDDTVGVTRPAAGRVGFFSCHELNNRFFPVVFLVGCSEAIFPALREIDEFVPYGELQAALATALPETRAPIPPARSPEEQMKDEYGLLLHAITRATGLLVVTAPEQFGGQYYPAPCFVLSGTQDRGTEERPPGNLVPPLARLSRTALRHDKSLLEGMARAVPLARYWGAKSSPPPHFSVPPFALSSSSLGAYVYCPRKFFYQKVLRVPEKKMIEFELGNLIHRILETVCAEHPSPEELLAFGRSGGVRASIAAALAEERGTERGIFYERLLERRLAHLAGEFFKLEASRAGAYRIAALENMFGFSFGGWSFAGCIDRIDRGDDERLHVIDYKTGAGEVRTASTLRKRVVADDPAYEDRNWQVPLYAWALHETEGAFPRAYSHYLMQADKAAKVVMLEIVRSESERDLSAAGSGRDAPSYVLHDELAACLEYACGIASEIFGSRASFERAEDARRCRMCRFRTVCRRSGNGTE
jgi:superfamily I DNA/RNA helicase/CRISPR/Cas system-associated exonuclease Cas4 (RecB family)